MNDKRFMHGTADLSGSVHGTLKIGAMVQRHPYPKYECECTQCGAISTVMQKALMESTAVCRSSDCGKAALREELEMTPRKYAQKLNRIEQEKIDKVASEYKQKLNAIAMLERDQIAEGVDDQFDLRRIDPACCEVRMSAAQADRYNADEYRLFVADTPGWFNTPANLDVVQRYLTNQGCESIVSSKMLKFAFNRLDSYGLLEHRQAPQPVVQQQPRQPAVVTTERAPAVPKPRESEEGWDLSNGERRMYTPYEIDRMSADEFKRIFRLYGERAPRFPTHASF
jgi:hypothetical protein